MKTKNMIICLVVGVILVALLSYSAFSMITPQENNTTEMNLSLNDTNNTTGENVTTTSTTKKSKQSSKKSSDDDGVYFDEELNTYFDRNDRSAYDGQFEKGTSKSEMKEALAEMERESNI